MIRNATVSDIPAIAEIHSAALPEDFLPRLGRRFLRNVFYPRTMNSKQAIVMVQEKGGSVCSFIVFAHDVRKLTSDATGNKIVLAVYLFAALIRHIALFKELISHLKNIKTDPLAGLDLNLAGVPELYVMASAPSCQSQGLGGELLDEGLKALAAVHPACLVRTSSEPARQFYAKHGFREIGVERRGQRKIRLLLRGDSLDSPGQ